MCCGKNRDLLKQSQMGRLEADAAILQAPTPTPPAPTMAVAHRQVAPAFTHQRSGVVFESKRKGALIAIGGATGARYYFAGLGTRVHIDPRDRDLLAMMDMLVEVRDAEPAMSAFDASAE
jgi:hypothetical protein